MQSGEMQFGELPHTLPHIIMNITCGLMISQDRNLIRLFVTCITIFSFCETGNTNSY
ncbi:hypothetical protein H8356DRAFT_1418385 [Neocallimastix lanati (nom. inval.)]|nr:hypothetical protein H8356DRAFT_1418385 [Neocallimastix sp. JGI-2020a]